MSIDDRKLNKARGMTYGIGLLKGMAVTLKHLFKHNTVIQYPDEKQDLGPRTRGVIALKEENCTVCMLCARECPDWCIYIDSHKETLPPKREGGRPRKRNVLDRFAIDYALCMYCGICVEVCPYDALFWSREFEYAEYDIRNLTHEKEKLSDWMATVLPPPPLDRGAELPGQQAAASAPAATPAPAATAPAATAPAAGATTPTASPTTTPPPDVSAADAARLPAPPRREAPPAQKTAAQEEPEQAKDVPPPAEAAAPSAAEATQSDVQAGETKEQPLSEEQKAAFQESPGPNVEVPHESPKPVALTPTEDGDTVYKEVLQEQKDKGSSPQVAEARARVAKAKAERGIKRGPTPLDVDKPVASAPIEGEGSGAPQQAATSGAPEEASAGSGPDSSAKTESTSGTNAASEDRDGGAAVATPVPEPGAGAVSEDRDGGAEVAPPVAESGTETPDEVYERVLAEETGQGLERCSRARQGESSEGEGREGAEVSAETVQEVMFWVLAVIMVGAAFRVVTTQNVVHAALYLVGTLMGAAALYVLFLAEFVAWAQVLIYVGAVVVLMLFGLMLTRAPIGKANYDNSQKLLAAVVAASLFGVTSWILMDAFDGAEITLAAENAVRTKDIGEVIFSAYVLPFEVVSVLLLAALIGAVMIARRDENPTKDGD